MQGEGRVQRGGAKGGKREARSQLHGSSGLNEYHRAREVGQQQQEQGRVGLRQMDRQEPERAVQEYRRAADVVFGLSEESEELRWEGGAMSTV
jgi:hypothetical protein